MLISRVVDDNGMEAVGGAGEARSDEDNLRDYETANELFELLAKDHNFEPGEDDTLTQRDLVFLYKNLDLGTQLMSNAKELKRSRPNQHVETVVYNYNEDDSEGSDLSQNCSDDYVHNVFLLNDERLDILDTGLSKKNSLCNKFGKIDIQNSNLTSDYNGHFLFKDPYIQSQLQNLNLISTTNEFEGNVFPASLLDYICCKRLEDNYNFYMDNVIRYVRNTIDQLKRISNGDYLTDRAKEKWREVEDGFNKEEVKNKNTKMLATSTSIPLHVERKCTGLKSKWDDLVHSEVDLRSLSKILEKKIVFEVPKLICSTYKFLSKSCADNLIISCKKDLNSNLENKEDSRVDVVLKIKRSDSGNIISNISSIIVLQTAPGITQAICDTPLPLPYNDDLEIKHNTPIITEHLIENTSNSEPKPDKESQNKEKTIYLKTRLDLIQPPTEENVLINHDIRYDQVSVPLREVFDLSEENDSKEENEIDTIHECQVKDFNSCQETKLNESALGSDLSFLSSQEKELKTNIDCEKHTKSNLEFDIISSDELSLTMQRLNAQGALTEESGDDNTSCKINLKRKSPTRARIKSPYENQSLKMEEKKRKKLLEIRERREKKKLAMSENCKIMKHKYGKGYVVPQASNSVTRLSITNKSFYNSIYGQNVNFQSNKQLINKYSKKSLISSQIIDEDPDIAKNFSEDMDNLSVISTERDNKKYINRSYYLDDVETEMMQIKRPETKDTKDTFSASSAISGSDFNAEIKILSQIMTKSTSSFTAENNLITRITESSHRSEDLTEHKDNRSDSTSSIPINVCSKINASPVMPEKVHVQRRNSPKKLTLECRKSIDKIYDLMKSLKKPYLETKDTNSKFTAFNIEQKNYCEAQENYVSQGSDSGTSLKHHLTSSNPSSFSFEDRKKCTIKKQDTSHTVIQKVVISSKSQIPKLTNDRQRLNQKDKKHKDEPSSIQDSPIKAISQLLQGISIVQKSKQKGATENKMLRKPDIVVPLENKINLQDSSQLSRFEQLKDRVGSNDRYHRNHIPRKPKPPSVIEQRIVAGDKRIDKTAKKKITDILDEEKEARGEAVKGPPKSSRLNALAQPKKFYVQAHRQEFESKYGRSLISDRLQRLAGTVVQQLSVSTPYVKRNVGSPSPRSKPRKPSSEVTSAVSVRPAQPAPSSPERLRSRRSPVPSGETISSVMLNQPPYKKNDALDTTHKYKKLMEVESYVKNHYGRSSADMISEDNLHTANKARVPYVPNDIELESISSSAQEESSALGGKLHQIVNNMISNVSTLSDLQECSESNSKFSRDNIDNISLAENLSKVESLVENLSIDEHVSVECSDSITSDYPTDIFQDKSVLTAVGNIPKVSEDTTLEIPVDKSITNKNVIQKSKTELQKLEDALQHQKSIGVIQKRLRIKNFTLTPKHSMQQIIVLQSGDAGSLVVKSTISQQFKITASEDMCEVKPAIKLRKNADWDFAEIPKQVATVGYAFSNFKSIECAPLILLKSVNENPASFVFSNMKNKENMNFSNATFSKSNDSSTDIIEKKFEQSSQAVQNDFFLESCHLHENIDQIGLVDHEINLRSNKNDQSINHNAVQNINYVGDNCIRDIASCIEKEQQENSTGTDLAITEIQCKPIEDQHLKCELPLTHNETEPIVSCKETETTKENLNYSNSLDLLVGLLNEIQKISTCQTKLANDLPIKTESGNKDIETVFKQHCPFNYTKKQSHNLDDEQSKSSLSVYSVYTSNEVENKDAVITGIIGSEKIRTVLYEDKQISTNIPEREYVNRFTDVPSRLFSFNVHQGTNVTRSLNPVAGEPADQPMYSFTEYKMLYSNSSFNSSEYVMELPKTRKTSRSTLEICQNSGIVKDTVLNKELNESKNYIPQKTTDATTKNKMSEPLNRKGAAVNVTQYRSIKRKTSLETIVHKTKGNSSDINSDFDSVMKIKRDILVTFYSILVITVFAALSFPGIIYGGIK